MKVIIAFMAGGIVGFFLAALLSIGKSVKPKLMPKPLKNERFWWYCGHCGASRHTNTKHRHCSYCGGKVDWEGLR